MKDLTKQNKLSNTIDKLIISILSTLKTIALIILLLFSSAIPSAILMILNIDANSLSNTTLIIISFINDILLILLLVLIYRKTIKSDLLEIKKNFVEITKIAFKYYLVGIILMITSNYLIGILMNGQISANEESVRSFIDKAPLYMAFQLAIYAPLTEELIFRRSIRDITKNKYIYILLSGFIFGMLHVITSISSPIDFIYLIPYCSFGFAFAALYIKTDNIFSTIIIHAFHNSFALILYLISGVLWKKYFHLYYIF